MLHRADLTGSRRQPSASALRKNGPPLMPLERACGEGEAPLAALHGDREGGAPPRPKPR